MARIVAAFGDGVLDGTREERGKKAARAAASVAGLKKQGHELLIMQNGALPGEPTPLKTELFQALGGFLLRDALRGTGNSLGCVSVVTQFEVSENDPAFAEPSSPEGKTVSEQEAVLAIMFGERGYIEDAEGRWRRAVPQPKPVSLLQKDAIAKLLGGGYTVIACSGAPVVRKDERYEPVTAATDFYLSAATAAKETQADVLLLLSDEDRVRINLGREDEHSLATMTVGEAKHFIAEGQFSRCGMLPRVEAALDFVRSGYDRRAVIAPTDTAAAAMLGESGTVIL